MSASDGVRQRVAPTSSPEVEDVKGSSPKVAEQKSSAAKSSCCGSRVLRYGIPVATAAAVGAGYLAYRMNPLSK